MHSIDFIVLYKKKNTEQRENIHKNPLFLLHTHNMQQQQEKHFQFPCT